MPEYRAYILDRKGKIQSFEPLICANDDVAVAHAQQVVDGHDVELWQANRKVTKLAHQADPNKIG
jgi:hypothetical protein